jgi:hypothetical protein
MLFNEMNAPIYRSEDYYRMRARHGDTPEEIAKHKACTWPETSFVPPAVSTVRPRHKCGPAITALFSRATSRPSLKELVDAMRADGFPDTDIHRARTAHTQRRATMDKRQAELEKLFGTSSRSTPVAKKVLKPVKKKV